MKTFLIIVFLHLSFLSISQNYEKVDTIKLFNSQELQNRIENSEVFKLIEDTLDSNYLFYNKFWTLKEVFDIEKKSITFN